MKMRRKGSFSNVRLVFSFSHHCKSNPLGLFQLSATQKTESLLLLLEFSLKILNLVIKKSMRNNENNY